MSEIKVPCKDCKDRQIGCHSKCEKYLEFKKQNDEIKRKQRIEKQAEYDYWVSIINNKKR